MYPERTEVMKKSSSKRPRDHNIAACNYSSYGQCRFRAVATIRPTTRCGDRISAVIEGKAVAERVKVCYLEDAGRFVELMGSSAGIRSSNS